MVRHVNGATYTPAHPAIDTPFGDHIPAQTNNIIHYPNGAQVEFNNQGVVSMKTPRQNVKR